MLYLCKYTTFLIHFQLLQTPFAVITNLGQGILLIEQQTPTFIYEICNQKPTTPQMKTETIRTITIEDFKKDPHLIDYVDENLIILDSVETTLPDSNPVKLDCFIIAFCIKGETTININGKSHPLNTNHCAIILPNTIIRHLPNTKRCTFRILAISSQFMIEAVNGRKETWDISYYLFHNPIFPINRNNSYKLYLYKELALTCINEKERPYSKEVKKHLFSAIFCELLGVLHRTIPIHEDTPDFRYNRSAYIFRKFLEKVNEDDGSHRSVAYYADLLCYSPKHFSTVIKKISGRTPLSIINEHAMEQIKYQLKHSDMSIKEVADRFNFTNPSFFGKFVKAHTGMSPLQYRNSNVDK